MNVPPSLFLASVATLHVALPATAWLLFGRSMDRAMRMWFTGLTVYGAGALFVALGILWSSELPLMVMPALGCVTMTFLIQSVRLELGLRPLRLGTFAMALAVWAGVFFPAYFLGRYMDVGLFWTSAWMGASAVLTGVLLWRLHQRGSSRAVRLMVVAAFVQFISHLARMILIAGFGEKMSLLSGGVYGVAIVTAYIVSFVFYVMGGWGLHLEKLDAQQAKAQMGEHDAHLQRERMDLELRHRDDLLLANSRFATVAGLSVYSAALVHEISQPLQTARLSLEGALARQPPADPQGQLMVADVEHALAVVLHASDIVAAMRDMMSGGRSDLEAVDVREALQEVQSVIASAAHRHGIAFDFRDDGAPAQVLASKVMLMRLVFNLAGNAVEELQHAGAGTLSMELRGTGEVSPGSVCLVVTDNGRGMDPPPAPGDLFRAGFASSKFAGMGLGLALCQSLVRQWGGEMIFSAADPGASRPGTRIEIRLPAAQSNPLPTEAEVATA